TANPSPRTIRAYTDDATPSAAFLADRAAYNGELPGRRGARCWPHAPAAAAGAMGCRFHRAGPVECRDGLPHSHPFSLMKPQIHRTPSHRIAPDRTGRGEQGSMKPQIHRIEPGGAGRRGATNSRIHRNAGELRPGGGCQVFAPADGGWG